MNHSHSTQPRLTCCHLKIESGLAQLTLQDYDTRNALTGTELQDELCAALGWIASQRDIRVLLLTGTRDCFSAGGHILDMALRKGDFSGDPAELRHRYLTGIQRIPRQMEALEIPVIAAINGVAVGAGFDLAAMADIRIASSQAKMGETFINLGLVAGDGGAWYLQRMVGYQRAIELALSGRMISAEEALDYGIVLEVCDPDILLTRARQLAAEIAARPPEATRLNKRLLKLAQRSQLDDFLAVCAAYQGISHHQPEHDEALEPWRNRTRQEKGDSN